MSGSIRPVIGITTSATTIPIEADPLEIRYAPTVYDDAILAAGGLPVHLPLLTGETVEEVLSLVDGIILSGGGDVDPASYGRPAEVPLSMPELARDRAEEELVHAALARSTPVLGICRGLQMLNVALGGSLVQDLERAGGLDHHYQDVPTAGPTHPIALEHGSRLAAAYGTDRIDVNSVHHQAVEAVAPRLIVTARSLDGVVEGLELGHGCSWVVAVQWHPEAMQAEDPAQRRVFRALVAAARAARAAA